MKTTLQLSLSPTLGCGQAHRWRLLDTGEWQGVIKNSVVTVKETEEGIDFEGCSRKDFDDYFRACDDLGAILTDISSADPYVAGLASRCPGLRILKQPEWECLATYVLATNVNVKRISKMVESVCDHFGKDLGPRRAFPSPGEILDKKELIGECKLGFREGRFLELAERTESGEIDLGLLSELDYPELVSELQKINGVGPKVADCTALFGFGKLEAFPVDVRIQHCMETMYGVTGNYRSVSEYGRNKFGKYAGYAQELLYHSEFIRRSPERRIRCRRGCTP